MASRGFTLVELLTVILLIVIIVAIGGPSFSATLNGSRVQKTAEYLVQLINTARSEALRRNSNVYLEVTGNTFCLGTTTPCTGDIRTDSIATSITVTPSLASLRFDNVRGLPSSTGADYTISGAGVTRTVSVNMLGLVKTSGG
ncbi:GspH/FimT family pseudopilin [Aeromonas caviae]|uniref:GspH/FimT family pseudopilin n=1 Tax=Aeromonas caviae TaxID=648 RepID=UPI00244D30F2|nr:GspH/FimT family pseudopilin [Aeromonas caviae]MDH1221770.1 GspH/FimT family pseudopilin [Aeromonas caviae]MDT8955291.1 GspH/FimT family pseudopilin [Aeromonas caviae]